MAIVIQGNPSLNVLDVPDGFLEQSSGIINFMGQGSTVKIGVGSWGYALHIVVEHDCTVEIGSRCALGALEVFSVRASSIYIDDNCGFTSKCAINAHEKNSITIGKGCLLASSTWITSSDMHTITDLNTGERINFGADITIGEHVWLANSVTVLKGVTIGNGSIVGTSAVVTTDVGENCLAVGNPARVIKQNVAWNHEL